MGHRAEGRSLNTFGDHLHYNLREATADRNWDRVTRVLNRLGEYLGMVDRGAV